MRPEKMPRWSEAEIAILKTHCGVSSYQTIRDLLPGRTDSAIENQARSLGLPVPIGDKMPRWSEAEITILQEHYGKTSYKHIHRLLSGRSAQSIQNQARHLGLLADASLSMRIQRTGYRKHQFNQSFFTQPNPENCYWAGFIAADGCIVQSPTPRLKIDLHADDIVLLERFSNAIAYAGNISVRKSVAKLDIAITDAIVQELADHFSITPRKSLTLLPPKIAQASLVAAFITGYIDGDGSLGYSDRDRSFRLGIRGTKPVLDWIKHWFDFWVPVHRPQIISISDRYPKYQIAGRRLLAISDILLMHAPYYLPRKWNKLIAFRYKE